MAAARREIEEQHASGVVHRVLEDLVLLSGALDRGDDAVALPAHPASDAEVAGVRVRALLGVAGTMHRRNLGECEPLFARALTVAEESFGAVHPTVATVLRERAAFLVSEGRVAEATALYRRALAVLRETVGSDHPDPPRPVPHLRGGGADGGGPPAVGGGPDGAAALNRSALRRRDLKLESTDEGGSGWQDRCSWSRGGWTTRRTTRSRC